MAPRPIFSSVATTIAPASSSPRSASSASSQRLPGLGNFGGPPKPPQSSS